MTATSLLDAEVAPGDSTRHASHVVMRWIMAWARNTGGPIFVVTPMGKMEPMNTDRTEQLALLADDVVDGGRRVAWRLDEATRRRGRQGVAAARRALADAAARRAATDDGHIAAA